MAKLSLVFVLLAISACDDRDEKYDCEFDNNLGTFQVGRFELRGSRSLIIVSRDGREFMFARRLLMQCELIK